MSRLAQSYQGVALITPVTVPYCRSSDHGAAWFIGRALAGMLDRCGLEKSAVDGLAVSSFSLAPDSVITLTEHFGLEPRWLEQIPLGGASGVVAMRRAARAVQAGDAEIIACIGGDTAQADSFGELVSKFSNFSIDAAYPYGGAGPNAAFSLITQHYMDTCGATSEDFGRIAVAQRYNANHYPDALFYSKTMTMQDYLDETARRNKALIRHGRAVLYGPYGPSGINRSNHGARPMEPVPRTPNYGTRPQQPWPGARP